MRISKIRSAYNSQADALGIRRATRAAQRPTKCKPAGALMQRVRKGAPPAKLTATKLELVNTLSALIEAHDIALQTLASYGEKLWHPHIQALAPARKMLRKALKDLAR